MAITRPLISLPTLTDENALSHDDLHQIALIQKDTGRGGLWWSEVQAALQYLFGSRDDVFVASSLLGELHALPLRELLARKIKFVAFSLPAASINNRGDFQHQVAVWIDMQADKVCVHVYNSEGKSLNEKAMANLKILIGDVAFDFIFAESPYEWQTDFWSCGLHVVMNLLHAYSNKTVTSKEKLNVTALIQPIYVAAKRGMRLLEEREIAINQQVTFKSTLNELLQKNKIAILKNLTTFIHFELNAATMVGGEVDHEYLRTRSLQQTLNAFKMTYPGDRVGHCVLQTVSWASAQLPAMFVEILNKVLAIFAKGDVLRPLCFQNSKADRLENIDKIYWMISSSFDMAENASSEWQKLFDVLMAEHKKTNQEMLKAIFNAFEDFQSYQALCITATNDQKNAYYLVCYLLMAAIDHVSLDDKNAMDKRNRVANDAAAREEQAEKNAKKYLPTLKNVFAAIQPMAVGDACCIEIASNPVLFFAIKKYFTLDYFAGCDQAAKQNVLQEILKLTTVNFIEMIALYPGNEAEKFYKSQSDNIDSDEIALKVLVRIKRRGYQKIFYDCYKRYLCTPKMQRAVINTIAIDERLDVAKDFSGFVSREADVKELLDLVDKKHKPALAGHFMSFRNQCFDYALKYLSSDEILELTATCKNEIQSRHVVSIAKSVIKSECMSYARKFKHLLTDKDAVLVLRSLPLGDRREFLNMSPRFSSLSGLSYAQYDDLTNSILACDEGQLYSLSEVIGGGQSYPDFDLYIVEFKKIPVKLQTHFMQRFISDLSAAVERYHVRMPLVPADLNKAYDLLMLLLNHAASSQRLKTAIKFSSLVTSTAQLANIIVLLDASDNDFTFIDCIPKLKMTPIQDIVSYLPNRMRLPFAKKHCARIDNSDSLVKTLAVLQPDEQSELLRACGHCVKSFNDVVLIVSALTNDASVIDFISENGHLIQSEYEFEAIVNKHLSDENALTLFSKLKDKVTFSVAIVKIFLSKLIIESKKKLLLSIVTFDSTTRLRQESCVFNLLFNQNPIPQIHYPYLIHAVLQGKMIANENNGMLILWTSSLSLTFENNHLPTFFRESIHQENKNKLSYVLWPLMILIDEGKVTIDDLAWLSDNKQPERTDNLVAILNEMYGIADRHIFMLLNSGFSVAELLDCRFPQRLKMVIEGAPIILKNLQLIVEESSKKEYKRAMLGIDASDEKVKSMVTTTMADIENNRLVKLQERFKIFDPSVTKLSDFPKMKSSVGYRDSYIKMYLRYDK